MGINEPVENVDVPSVNYASMAGAVILGNTCISCGRNVGLENG
jgi:hypothetical protein